MTAVQAGVDFCAPCVAVGSSAPAGEASAAEFMCNACNEAFSTAAEQRVHCKLERHVYNTKRRLAGLKPIGQEAWERKLREARGTDGAGPSKGTAHLKAGKRERKAAGSDAGNSASTGGYPVAATPPVSEAVPSESAAADAQDAAKEFEGPFTLGRCLFDRKTFDDMEQNLEYMRKTYDFNIPDREYCTDVPRLLEFLWQKVTEPPYTCLFCNKKFVDAVSCRRHMLDKRHTRIGTEAKTRTGGTDEAGSEEMKAELEEFFDFTSSTLEVTEKVRNPAERVGCILRFFDADRDGRLQHSELSVLWAAAGGGAELSQAMYAGACGKAGVDPEEGLDGEALGKLYSEGLADLDAHFRVLQDLLAKKLSSRTKARQAIAEEGEDEEGEDEEGDEDAADKEEDGDSVDVLECEDEDEFEEVMRILGLQAVTINENGDLRLPNGTSAAHRDVAHIWKQRGNRLGPLALFNGRGGGKRSVVPMLTDAPGGATLAISRRQEVREEKKYVAVLKNKQKYDLGVSMMQNNLQKRATKIRTGLGDASGGR